MNEYILSANPRSAEGKGGARQLRLKGFVPGVYYGHNEPNIHFAIGQSDLNRMLRGRQRIIALKIGNDEPRQAVIRELQKDPVNEKLLHIDLLGIHSGEVITISVPVRLTGVAAGVKLGGILEHGLAELSVECLPADIPEAIEVDVAALEMGDSVHIRDLSIPNVRLLDDPNATVAHVAAPTIEKEVVTAPAEGEEAEAATASEEPKAE